MRLLVCVLFIVFEQSCVFPSRKLREDLHLSIIWRCQTFQQQTGGWDDAWRRTVSTFIYLFFCFQPHLWTKSVRAAEAALVLVHSERSLRHGLCARMALQRSAALRGAGALKSAPGSSFSHDVRRRESGEGERWAVFSSWVHTILLRHPQLSRQIRWTAYPGSCKWCCTEAHFDPTPLGGLVRSLHPSFKSLLRKRAQR